MRTIIEQNGKEVLTKELGRVKQKVKILDMIEEGLLRMWKLAKTVASTDLDEEQIMAIQGDFPTLKAELNLLGLEQMVLLLDRLM